MPSGLVALRGLTPLNVLSTSATENESGGAHVGGLCFFLEAGVYLVLERAISVRDVDGVPFIIVIIWSPCHMHLVSEPLNCESTLSLYCCFASLIALRRS